MPPARTPILAALAMLVGGCTGVTAQGSGERAVPPLPINLQLTSPDFRDGEPLPVGVTCDGSDGHPALRWTGVPPSARELVLIVSDADASGKRFVHWTVYGLNGRLRGLEGGKLPPGARQGRNDFGGEEWGEPCAPDGDGPHRYQFDLYWLTSPTRLEAGASPLDVAAALGRASGRGTLEGTHER